MSKKDKKQFPLTSKENCAIYLCRIISSCELCMDRYKIYNKEAKLILEQYEGKDKIPYDIYSNICDKTGNVMCYILNLLGDCQSTSISYFKYRKQIKKLINKGIDKIPLYSIDEKIENLLIDFNKMRNWQNHVPESLLVAEVELMKNGELKLSMNPMDIIHYNYVSYEYFADLHDSNLNFYKAARKLIQSAKKDYSLLMDSKVSYPRQYSDTPVKLNKSEPAKMSAKIQGIKGSLDDE